jgi:hypothetical protein
MRSGRLAILRSRLFALRDHDYETPHVSMPTLFQHVGIEPRGVVRSARERRFHFATAICS